MRSLAVHVGRGGYAVVVSEFYASSERPEGWVPPSPGLDALLVRDPRQAENPLLPPQSARARLRRLPPTRSLAKTG